MSSHAINLEQTSLSDFEQESENRRRAKDVSVNLNYIYNQAGGAEAEYYITLEAALRARSHLNGVGSTIIDLYPVGEPEVVSIWQDKSVAYRVFAKAPLTTQPQSIHYSSGNRSPVFGRVREDTSYSSPSYSPKYQFDPDQAFIQSTSSVSPTAARRCRALGKNIEGRVTIKSSDQDKAKGKTVKRVVNLAQREGAKFSRHQEEEDISTDTPADFLDLEIKQEPDW